MKIINYILLLPILCYVQDIEAQSANNKYLNPAAVWAVVADNKEQTGADTDISYCYTWGLDSIINGFTYRTVYWGHSHPGEFLDMLEFETYDSILFYREEGKKIFRFDNDLSKDVLLYDFGLQVGDETTIQDGKRVRVAEEFCADKLDNYCYSIYTQNNEPPKAWRVCGVDDDTYEDIWIDGAGSLYTGLLLRSDYPEDVSLTTVFNPSGSWSRYTKYDKIQPVLLKDYWEEPDYDGNMEDFHIDVEFVDDTLKISGFSRFFYYTHLFRCHLDGNEIRISAIPVNPRCVMILGLLYSKYEIKFSGFEAGTYTVKKESERFWSEESNKWQDVSVVCHGPATRILEITTLSSKQSNNVIYDLSGRRLNQVPERGFYIQNGKVIFR